MRDFLDAILEHINSESLTDEEFETIDLDNPPTANAAMYAALRTILEAREELSSQIKKLKLYFISAGVDLSSSTTGHAARSNIYIGDALD